MGHESTHSSETLEPAARAAAHEISSPSETTELSVGGMSCSNCVRHVTEAIQSVPGVGAAAVDLEHGSASVTWLPNAQPDIEALLQAIQRSGYQPALSASPPTTAGERSWTPLRGWKFNVVFGSLATALLMIGEWVFGLA